MRILKTIIKILPLLILLYSCGLKRHVAKTERAKTVYDKTATVTTEHVDRKAKQDVTIDADSFDYEIKLKKSDGGKVVVGRYKAIDKLQGLKNVSISVENNTIHIKGLRDRIVKPIFVDEHIDRNIVEHKNITTNENTKTKDKTSKTSWTGLYTIIGVVLVVALILVFLYFKGIIKW